EIVEDDIELPLWPSCYDFIHEKRLAVSALLVSDIHFCRLQPRKSQTCRCGVYAGSGNDRWVVHSLERARAPASMVSHPCRPQSRSQGRNVKIDDIAGFGGKIGTLVPILDGSGARTLVTARAYLLVVRRRANGRPPSGEDSTPPSRRGCRPGVLAVHR